MTNPAFQDLAPTAATVTQYDRECSAVYLRLLDADEAGADWKEVVPVVFGLDPMSEPERSHAIYASHLERARWMSRRGFRDLVWPKT